MKNLRLLTMLGLVLTVAPYAHAQRFGVAIGVGPVAVGPAPVCPYGYFDYYPYACAPYGYYGPDWFSGGIFIGAGPWFHGFHGAPGFRGAPAFRADRGFNAGRGNFGRIPAAPVHPAFRGGVDRGAVGRFNAGGVHGSPHVGAAPRGAGAFHGGGRR